MVLGVMIASLLAQAEPDAAQILKKVSEIYAHRQIARQSAP